MVSRSRQGNCAVYESLILLALLYAILTGLLLLLFRILERRIPARGA